MMPVKIFSTDRSPLDEAPLPAGKRSVSQTNYSPLSNPFLTSATEIDIHLRVDFSDQRLRLFRKQRKTHVLSVNNIHLLIDDQIDPARKRQKPMVRVVAFGDSAESRASPGILLFAEL
jgi:hypothetical protein